MTFIFKIKIDGSQKPPIWRKVKVNDNLSFDDFHTVIQILFGWQNAHLYRFSPKGWGSIPEISQDYEDDFGMDEPLSPPNTFPYGERYDAKKIMLNDYFKAEKQKITYTYDFGDDWSHTVELIEITDETILYPVCTAGKGSDLEEDCGGIWGFYDMVEAVNNPKHPEHKEYREWLGMKQGEKWDVNFFDLEGTNELLREVWKRKKTEKK
jgi:hypothetical protein